VKTEERFHNWITGDGAISTIGVELMLDSPEMRAPERLVWMAAPPVPGMWLLFPDNDPFTAFKVTAVHARVFETGDEALRYGTYIAYGEIIP
jgi:hypothetical protein